MNAQRSVRRSSWSPLIFFQRLNEKPLQYDLRFFFAVVVVTAVVFMLLPLFAGSYPPDEFEIGLHRLGVLVSGILIGLLQGLICGAVALLGISLIEHFSCFSLMYIGDLKKTMKSAIYALAPFVLFFWAVVIVQIPFMDLLLLLGFGLATYFGVRIFHEMSRDRAAFLSLATSVVFAILFHRWVFDFGSLL